MAKPVDEMLTRWVTPVLRRRGWRKTGRTYRFGGAGQDQALIYIQGVSASQTGYSQFFVQPGAVPAAQHAWTDVLFNPTKPTAEPRIAIALWFTRLRAPEAVERTWMDGGPVPFGTDEWTINLDDPNGMVRCGEILAHTLQRWAPVAETWNDRKQLAAFIDDPGDALPMRPRGGWRTDGILIVDDGPSAALDAVIAAARSHDDSEFADWLEARASSTGGNGPQTSR